MSLQIARNDVLQQLKSAGEPLAFAQLCECLGVAAKADKRALTQVLEQLAAAGQVLVNRRGHYGLVQQMDLQPGTVIGHADGFGFLKTDIEGPDWYLSPREMARVFPGDRVVARLDTPDRRGRDRGAIVEVLERKTTALVGRLHIADDLSWVVPQNPVLCHHVLVPTNFRGEGKDGDLVKVQVLRQPEPEVQPLGRVSEVLGRQLNAALRIDVALSDFGLPVAFPEGVEPAPASLPQPQLTPDCEDARSLEFVTIDGADAKDFDDAVTARKTARGWRVWVAIADVSRYVQPGTPLDQEARERGTSAYFPGRVVPMLPPVLSDDLCSLRPEVDRHALICEMLVGRNCQVRLQRFFPGLIRSRARLIYEDVAAVLEQGSDHPQAAQLHTLNDVFLALHAARETRGALDFESRDTQIELGPEGQVQDIVPVARTRAHRLIEEIMIAANVCAARYLARHKLPNLNRIHPPPTSEAVTDFRAFLGEWGLKLGGRSKPGPEDYHALLQEARERPEGRIVQAVLLRNLTQAQYSPSGIGHFGLGLPEYAHFTSPIRRYPDLIVHRGIKHILAGGGPHDWPFDENQMRSLGELCSNRERRAEQAAWSVIEALKCDYLADHEGEEFEGEVTGVTNFGLFVELEGVRASGLVHISNLGRDYFHFEAVGHRLRGERSGQMFRLGDRMRVRLSRVDADARKMDLEALAHRPVVAYQRGKQRVDNTWREL